MAGNAKDYFSGMIILTFTEKSATLIIRKLYLAICVSKLSKTNRNLKIIRSRFVVKMVRKGKVMNVLIVP